MNHFTQKLVVLFLCSQAGFVFAQNSELGLFEGNGDIGDVLKSGSVSYDAAQKSYTVAGSGENMWATTDAFHFVWKKASGDISLASDIRLIGTGGHEHRKACLLIRQSLEPDSPYADAAVHGNGLTSIQYREVKGGNTHEIQSNVSAPKRVRIEKAGNYISMYARIRTDMGESSKRFGAG